MPAHVSLQATLPGASVRPAIRADEPIPAIGLAVLAGILFSCSDACAKQLALTLPPIEIAWLRWCGFLLFVTPAIVRTRGGVLRSQAPLLQVGRSLGLLGSSLLFVIGLQFLPLASATTIGFVSPLLVTALSMPLLGERVGWRRWAAVGAGLAGVLIVVRPGSGTFGIAAAYPLSSAACWAVGVILTRKLAGIDRPWTAMCYTAGVGFVVLGAAVPLVFVPPSLADLGLAACMAAAASVAQLLVVLAFGRAPASLLAPFTYVQLVWATAFGMVLFATVPDGWTWVGASVIIASGLYTAHRERVRAREAAAARAA